MPTTAQHRLHSICGWIIGALLLVVVCAPQAWAADTPRPSSVDPYARGELTVHKALGDPLTQFGDPTNPDADLSREPIQGLKFQIQRIEGIDLTTNDGWYELEDSFIVDYFEGGREVDNLGQAYIEETDDNGVAHFKELPIGAYLVQELPSAAQKDSLSLVSPFIVTIPTTNPDNRSEWTYSVEVNAKDQRIMANKDVSATCIEAGDTITYGISSTTPAPDHNGVIHRFEIADPISPELEFIKLKSKVSIQQPGPDGKNITLHADEDFSVVLTGGVAVLKLQDRGLEKLAKLRSGNPETTVSWTFEATGPAEATGQKIHNRGYVLVEGYPQFDPLTTPGVQTNRVTTQVGSCTPTTSDVETPVTDPQMPGDTDEPTTSTQTGEPGTDSPGSSGGGSSSGSSGSSGPLASTGASVIGLVIAGALLVAIGTWLSTRRGRSE
ncbi:SpaH/EbpB family LPXTG-anchored major pilin [Corynebacterium sp. TAE3-ERU30]|uniref:SpaH/EbpB family LPXTG-anchored major pilin n=1 Tax=Corynebacterium sp. TAE3-ERU30 TaxID=2849496 RepID=UPI001C48447C|nr:SpaH/EbpB family LPXTG-anchored major pilin [Corynebacterium sp. TAE3-ERU30]MBV7282597.1 SpaH/EbpB family LPXTG-anchored major pilin [Corynebacterium sp. TAE3-ERU30]